MFLYVYVNKFSGVFHVRRWLEVEESETDYGSVLFVHTISTNIFTPLSSRAPVATVIDNNGTDTDVN